MLCKALFAGRGSWELVDASPVFGYCCIPCVHWVQCDPNICVCLFMGTSTSCILMLRLVLTSFVLSVNSVADDLPGDTSWFRSLSQLLTMWNYRLSWCHCVGIFGPCQYCTVISIWDEFEVRMNLNIVHVTAPLFSLMVVNDGSELVRESRALILGFVGFLLLSLVYPCVVGKFGCFCGEEEWFLCNQLGCVFCCFDNIKFKEALTGIDVADWGASLCRYSRWFLNPYVRTSRLLLLFVESAHHFCHH